jgi:hypothetical protein
MKFCVYAVALGSQGQLQSADSGCMVPYGQQGGRSRQASASGAPRQGSRRVGESQEVCTAGEENTVVQINDSGQGAFQAV